MAATLFSVAALVVVTGLTFVVAPFAPNVSLGSLYLLAVVPVAAIFGLGAAIVVSVVSMVLFASIFLVPAWSLSLRTWQTWVALATYVGTSIVVSQLAVVFRNRAIRAEQGEREAAFLAAVSTELLSGTLRGRLPEIAARAAAVLEVGAARIVLGAPESPIGRATPLRANGRAVGWLCLVDGAEPDPRVAARVLPALASLLAVGLERERLALELVETEAVRRSDAMKTAILRSVSHDLRSPLTAIKAASAGLASTSARFTRAEREALVETISAEAKRLDELIADLIDLSRLEASAAEPVPELWTLDELLAGTLKAIGSEADRVEVKLPATMPAVFVDAAQIERVLVNIVGNALKFSKRDGLVGISVETSGEEVVIRVDDSGPGLAADLERLFLPFQTGGARPEGGGLGLGLAIAKGFADLNGGRIWANDSSEGTSFALALPAARTGVPIG